MEGQEHSYTGYPTDEWSHNTLPNSMNDGWDTFWLIHIIVAFFIEALIFIYKFSDLLELDNGKAFE